MVTILIAFLAVVGLFVWAIFRIRRSAASYSPTHKTWWVFVPANTGAIVVGKQNENTSGDGTGTVVTSGGPVLNLIHSIPGMKRKKVGPDPMAWPLESGEEDFGLIHWITGGAFFLGPWREIRICSISEYRFTKPTKPGENEEESYRIESRDYKTLFPYYSGALAVKVRGAEAKGTFTIDLDMNVLWERKYFIRSVLKVADANSVLTIMAEGKVVGVTGPLKPEDILAGKETVKSDIAKAVNDINDTAEERIGLSIYGTEVYYLDVNAEERKLFELKERTEREQAARIQVAKAEKKIVIISEKGIAAAQIIKAKADKTTKVLEGEADKAVGMMVNDVAADNVERVVLPVAKSPGGPMIRIADAIKETKVTVLNLGTGLGQILDLGSLKKNPGVPEPVGAST
jgi:hypothetical protein